MGLLDPLRNLRYPILNGRSTPAETGITASQLVENVATQIFETVLREARQLLTCQVAPWVTIVSICHRDCNLISHGHQIILYHCVRDWFVSNCFFRRTSSSKTSSQSSLNCALCNVTSLALAFDRSTAESTVELSSTFELDDMFRAYQDNPLSKQRAYRNGPAKQRKYSLLGSPWFPECTVETMICLCSQKGTEKSTDGIRWVLR